MHVHGGKQTKLIVSIAAVLAAAVGIGNVALAQPGWTPPAEPAVTPELPPTAELDTDHNRIDDAIDEELAAVYAAQQTETAPEARAALEGFLAASIRVELVFSRQVSQQQIDAFLALGGEIDHLYRAVSYGWTGRLPRSAVQLLPGALGPSLLIVIRERPVQLHLDEATRTGRVRPVWASGFAGSGSGFSGDSNTTIAVIDTGVDGSHTDLAGRMEFWNDYTSDGEPTPRDVIQHGSHVTGIALGTGAAFGLGPGTLHYTDSGDLTNAPSGNFLQFPIHLPSVPLTFTSTATWFDGGTTDLYLIGRADGSTASPSGLTFSSGSSPLTNTSSGTPMAGQQYAAALLQSASGITHFAVANSVTNYPAVGDGFNAFRGVAPGCHWAGAKVFPNAGGGASSLDIGAAMDDMVVQRIAHNIKVANMSFGLSGHPGTEPTERAKANTMVNNGIVTVVSAGNSGPSASSDKLIGDPGGAALVLTVAASNDVNELTQYTSVGFSSPGPDEDYKPDVMAPGGSFFYSAILSVDSNNADAELATFPDQVPNDYYDIVGTSMASPFAAGAASLVIDALQHAGLTWSFASGAHALLVKMLLCAAATESNANREAGSGSDPTLGRAAAPKDLFEGYGLINPDAAIEAVSLTYSCGALSSSTTGDRFDRRAWGRNMTLTSGTPVGLMLTVPATADYDLYLYSSTPDSKGNPVILASSTNAGLGVGETISFMPAVSETAYLFIKRISGSGAWSLSCSVTTTSTSTSTSTTTTHAPTTTTSSTSTTSSSTSSTTSTSTSSSTTTSPPTTTSTSTSTSTTTTHAPTTTTSSTSTTSSSTSSTTSTSTSSSTTTSPPTTTSTSTSTSTTTTQAPTTTSSTSTTSSSTSISTSSSTTTSRPTTTTTSSTTTSTSSTTSTQRPTTTTNSTTTTSTSTSTSTGAPTTTTTTATSTTSTTVPTGCEVAPTFASIDCRLDVLIAQVNATTDLGEVKAMLLHQLTRAKDRKEQAEMLFSEGQAARGQEALRHAIRDMIAFNFRVASLRGRRGQIGEAARGMLLQAGKAIKRDMQTLLDTL